MLSLIVRGIATVRTAVLMSVMVLIGIVVWTAYDILKAATRLMMTVGFARRILVNRTDRREAGK